MKKNLAHNYRLYFYSILFIFAIITLSCHYWFLVLKLNQNSNTLAMEFYMRWNTQIIIIIAIYSLINLLYYFRYSDYLKWITNFHLRNFINISLIISCFSYYINLIIKWQNLDFSSNYSEYSYVSYWIIMFLENLIIPIIFLVYCLMLTSKVITFKKNIWFYWIYPQIYSLIVIIRGYTLLKLKPYLSVNDTYHYFFLNISQNYGILIFFIASIIFFLIFTSFAILFILINNFIYKKYKGVRNES